MEGNEGSWFCLTWFLVCLLYLDPSQLKVSILKHTKRQSKVMNWSSQTDVRDIRDELEQLDTLEKQIYHKIARLTQLRSTLLTEETEDQENVTVDDHQWNSTADLENTIALKSKEKLVHKLLWILLHLLLKKHTLLNLSHLLHQVLVSLLITYFSTYMLAISSYIDNILASPY